MQATQPASRSTPLLSFPSVSLLNRERWLVGSHILASLLALSIGILLGPFQTFRRSPAFVEMFPDWQIPIFKYYYQALTAHGVMNAIFFTTFSIVGVSFFITQRALQRPLWNMPLAWAAFASMFAGFLSALFSIAIEKASVLYTFYPPLIAPPAFYIGLVLLVVGTWLASLNIFLTFAGWKRDNPGSLSPLAVFAILCNLFMWCIATVTVAIEILWMLLPVSLGMSEMTDPQFARGLFWFFGHPLVYFWLFIAYTSWYTMLPQQAGGKLFSDPLARIAMLMLAIFSVPVGVHHLYADPGVSEVVKFVHAFLTFIVAAPSLMTAFNVGAALERAGRRRGAKGRFDWMAKQDWENPVVAAQLAALFLFVMGGFSGMIQGSYTLNIALHNTSWVPGHFHTTLGSAVTLTIMGIVYWLIPLVRGRALWNRQMALGQIATWVIGMFIFSHGMGAAGIAGLPRRTDLGSSPYMDGHAAGIWLDSAAIGGTLLLISAVLFYINVIATLFISKKPVEEEVPFLAKADPITPLWFDRWWLWVGITVLIGLAAWGPVFATGFELNTPPYNPMGSPMR